jgi:hypothetical protein
VDVLVGPKHFPHVSSFLDCSELPYEIQIDDIQVINRA